MSFSEFGALLHTSFMSCSSPLDFTNLCLQEVNHDLFLVFKWTVEIAENDTWTLKSEFSSF